MIVSTGTASGKTLAFNLPVLNSLAAQPKNRALYLYPTKALAQDQARAISALGVPKVRAAIYDGDTPSEQRWQIRKWANVVLTNPDMLHIGVLPHHDRWGDVLSNLRYVVVDEAHVYRGVFGSHVGNVLRRLRRAAAIYGAEPQFLLASATIANPGEQAAALTGLDVRVVSKDAAAHAERTVAFWNPPLLDEEMGLRASPLGEAARILAQLVTAGQRTICFAKSRKAAELIHRFASRARRLGDRGPAFALPRRLHAGAAPRDRAAARRGRAARRHGHRRARARDRRRDARLRPLGRLPGDGREPAPAVGARRARAARARGAGRLRGRARPVLHARAGAAHEPARRGGHSRPRQPADPRRPRPRGCVRGAARRARREDARPRGALARAPPPGSEEDEGRLDLGGPRLPGGEDRPARHERRLVPDRGRGDRRRPRLGRARARVLDGARGSDLPPSGPVVPRPRSRPGGAGRDRRALRVRLLHPGEEGDQHGHRRGARERTGDSGSSSPSAACR